MTKKIVILFFVIILLTSMIACSNNQVNVEVLDTDPITIQPPELLEGMSQKSLQKEKDFLNAEIGLQKMINDERVMLKEFDKINIASKDDLWTPLFDFAGEWLPNLNFSGYQTTTGIGMYPRFFVEEDYYMFQQMIIETEKGKRFLEYNIFFTRDYGLINMERYSLLIKGVYGVDIPANILKETMLICEKELPTVTQESQFDHILYEQNKITIKMVAMEDVTGEKYIAICCRYKPEY